MKTGLWEIGFSHKDYGDNYSSVTVTARTGEAAIEKALKTQDEEDKLSVYSVRLLGRAD